MAANTTPFFIAEYKAQFKTVQNGVLQELYLSKAKSNGSVIYLINLEALGNNVLTKLQFYIKDKNGNIGLIKEISCPETTETNVGLLNISNISDQIRLASGSSLLCKSSVDIATGIAVTCFIGDF